MRKRSAAVAATDTADTKDPSSSTLARGFAILRAFRIGERWLGNVELADRVGLPKATVSRLTQVLTQLGYLSYSANLAKYELTPALLALGYTVLSRAEVNVLARPMLEALARECECSVGMWVRDGLDMVLIEQARGRHTAEFWSIAVGRRVPIALAAAGWAAAHQLAARQQAVLFEEIERGYAERAERIKHRMLQAFDDIYRQGFCAGIGEFSPAYNSVGVPLPSWSAAEPMTLHLAGPAFYLPEDDLRTIWGPRLVQVAARLRGMPA